MNFFETSTRNLLKYGADAGVKHLVALSVVGTNRLAESGYFRAKIAQQKVIRNSAIPYSVVHATQFFEFLKQLADVSFDATKVRLPDALFQPMAADDVATSMGRVAVGQPINGTVEIGGPEALRLSPRLKSGSGPLGNRNENLVCLRRIHTKKQNKEIRSLDTHSSCCRRGRH